MIAKGVGGGALHAGDGEVGERDPLEGGSALEEALLFRADSSFDAGLFGRWRPDLSPMKCTAICRIGSRGMRGRCGSSTKETVELRDVAGAPRPDKTEIPLRARQNARCRMTSLITLASMGIFFPGSALLSKTAGGFGSNVPVLLHLAFTPNMGLEYLH
jgi:hypothetical protein